MSRPYAPRQVLRHLPRDLLREFFDREGISLGVDWDTVRDGDPDPAYAAWLDLPPEHREAVEAMFRAVHDLAGPLATQLLVEEAAALGTPVDPAFPNLSGHHAQALWALVHRAPAFHHVARLCHAEQLPVRYWRTLAGLPGVALGGQPVEAANALRRDLAAYLRAEQGRGHRVTVEHYLRAGSDHYFFCYPDDYARTHVGHDRYGKLRRTPHRPAFEVVFCYAPATGTLDLYTPGDKAVRAAMEELFCRAVLGCDPPVVGPGGHVYELTPLLDPEFPMPTEPGDGVKEVAVRRVRVALPTPGERLVFEVDGGRSAAAFHARLAEVLDPARFPRHRLFVTLATFVLRYAAADGRDRPPSFGVNHANMWVPNPGVRRSPRVS